MNRKTLILLVAAVLLSASTLAQPVEGDTSEVRPGIVPGNPLYAVENFVEKIEVKIAGIIGGPELKAKAIANNAEERLAEANYLADRNKTAKAAQAVQRYSEGLNQSREIARGIEDERLGDQIENVSRKNQDTLEKVKKKVPEEALKAIQRAQEKSNSQRPDPPNRTGSKEKPPEGLNNSKREGHDIEGGKSSNSIEKPDIEEKPGKNLSETGNISGKADIENRSAGTEEDATTGKEENSGETDTELAQSDKPETDASENLDGRGSEPDEPTGGPDTGQDLTR